MAANIFVGSVDNNWGTAGNWSLGTVPTANDGHVATFDASSPNCSINSTARVCNNIDFTNYTNTISFDVTLTVSGNVTLGSSMIFAGSEALIVNANSTFTSNTKTVDVPLRLGLVSSTITVTLTDDLTPHVSFNGTANSSVVNLNGFNLILKNNVSLSITVSTEFKGTTLFKVTGACTWSTGFFSLQRIENNFTVDSTGTLTLSGQVYYRTGTFSVVTGGTIISTGSTFTSPFSAGGNSVVFDLNGQSLNNVSFEGTTDALIGITTDLLVNGNLSIGSANAIPYTFNGANIRISGNLTHNSNNNASVSGTANFIMNGTGTISQPNIFNTLTSFRSNLEINTSGTITFSGTFYYTTGTLKYTFGTVITTGSTLAIPASTTLNTNGITWNNITFNGGLTYTITLSSNLNLSGTLNVGLNSSSTITINSNNINLSGSLIRTGLSVIDGTTVINITGTGSWTDTASGGSLRNSIVFNTTTNTFTISGAIYYNTGTLTYTSGTIITTGSTLNILLATTLNTNGITWNNLSLTLNGTITLSSDLSVSGTLSPGNGSSGTLTINGSYIIYISGNLTVNVTTGFVVPGVSAPTIILNGTGVWSHPGYTSRLTGGALRINTTINTSGTITISGSIGYNSGTLTYIGGTVIATSATLHITSSSTSTTLNVNGITWGGLWLRGQAMTITLLSNITTGLLVSHSQNTSLSNPITVNGFNIDILGDFAVGSYFGESSQANGITNGTTVLRFVGASGNSNIIGSTILSCGLSIVINSTNNIIMSSTWISRTISFTYITSNSITWASNLQFIGNTTFDVSITMPYHQIYGTSVITLNRNFKCQNLFLNGIVSWVTNSYSYEIEDTLIIRDGTISLPNDLYLNTFAPELRPTQTIINGFTIYVKKDFIVGSLSLFGTTDIEMIGRGTMVKTSVGNDVISNNITINSEETIIGNFNFGGSKTFRYIKGVAKQLPGTTFQIFTQGSSRKPVLTDMHKIAFRNVVIGPSASPGFDYIIMNRFFSGTPFIETRVRSSVTGTRFDILFTDPTKKVSKFVRLSDCNLLFGSQLRVVGDNFCNKGNNNGVQFEPNQTPMGLPLNNGIPTNSSDGITFGTSGLLNDPIYN